MRRHALLFLVLATAAACAPPTKPHAVADAVASRPSPTPRPAVSATARPAPEQPDAPTPVPSAKASPLGPAPAFTPGAVVVGPLDPLVQVAAYAAGFPTMQAIAPAPGGGLLVSGAHRLTRVDPAGNAKLVAGGHVRTAARLTGVQALDAGFDGFPVARFFDGAGRALVVDGRHRVARLEADGTLTELWARDPDMNVLAAIPGVGDTAGVLASKASQFTMWSASPGAKPSAAHVFDDAANAVLAQAKGDGGAFYGGTTAPAGGVRDGKLYLRVQAPGEADVALWALDIRTYDLTLVDPKANAALMDAQANLFSVEGGTLKMAVPGQPPVVLASDLPTDAYLAAATQGSDGSVYAGYTRFPYDGGRIYEVKAGRSRPFSGRDPAALGLPSDMWLDVFALAALPTGELVVGEQTPRRLLRVRPGQPVEVLADRAALDAAAGRAARIGVTSLGSTAKGELALVYDGALLLRRDADGKLTRAYEAPDGLEIHRLAVAPDGTAYMWLARDTSTPPLLQDAQLVRLAPGAATAEPVAGAPSAPYDVAVDAAGMAYVVGFTGDRQGLELSRLGADGKLEGLGTMPYKETNFAIQGLAVDAQGRIYYGGGNEADKFASVRRYDPRTHAAVAVAGGDAKVLAGDTRETDLLGPSAMAFDAAGNLLVVDRPQVKRIAAGDL